MRGPDAPDERDVPLGSSLVFHESICRHISNPIPLFAPVTRIILEEQEETDMLNEGVETGKGDEGETSWRGGRVSQSGSPF